MFVVDIGTYFLLGRVVAPSGIALQTSRFESKNLAKASWHGEEANAKLLDPGS